jgi:hypothetical protein
VRKFPKDEKIKKLLSQKRKLELLAWVIPLISICSLLVILILLTNSLQSKSLIVLLVIIFLIVVDYIFDFKITLRIKSIYNDMNEYFQDKIVPQLLVEDNPTIVYNDELTLKCVDVDQIELFNNYAKYFSYFHYEGVIEGCKFTFDEVMFDDLVEYDTVGLKVFNCSIKKDTNYHWYIIDLRKEYPCEAIYKIDNFDNYESSLLRNYYKYDLTKKFELNPDNNLQIFIKDLKFSRRFVNEKMMKVLNDDYVVYSEIMAIYINQNKLHIVIEEFEDLINLNKTNKVTFDSLMSDFKNEQRIIRAIINALNS